MIRLLLWNIKCQKVRDNMKWLKDGLYINDNDELVTEEGKHFWIENRANYQNEENKNDISYRCSGCYVGFAEKTEICPNCKSEMDMTEWGCPIGKEEI